MADPDEIRKFNPAIIVIREEQKNTRCRFCRKSEINDLEWGSLCELGDVAVHYFCILFSSSLAQNGSDKEGILGFLPKDIKGEMERSQKLKCRYCKYARANVGCCVPKCKTSFHFTCGLQKGALFEFMGNFTAWCPKHRPAPAVEALKILENGWNCEICFNEVDLKEEFVWPPCCSKRVFHRLCIQRHARTAGYQFACPACKNMDQFNNAMRRAGVFIPEEDPSWERNREFDDLTRGYTHCDARDCYCPHGRDYDATQRTPYNRNWKMIRCNICGGSAVHYCCGQLKKMEFKCEECIVIWNRDSRDYVAVGLLPGHDDNDEPQPNNEGEDDDQNETNIADLTQEIIDEYDQVGRQIAQESQIVVTTNNNNNEKNRIQDEEKNARKIEITSVQKKKVVICPRTGKKFIMELYSSDDDDETVVIEPFKIRSALEMISSMNTSPPKPPIQPLLSPGLPSNSSLETSPVTTSELSETPSILTVVNSDLGVTLIEKSEDSITETHKPEVKQVSEETENVTKSDPGVKPEDPTKTEPEVKPSEQSPNSPKHGDKSPKKSRDSSPELMIEETPTTQIAPNSRGPIRIFWPRRPFKTDDDDIQVTHERLTVTTIQSGFRVLKSQALRDLIFKKRAPSPTCITLSDDDVEVEAPSTRTGPSKNITVVSMKLTSTNQSLPQRKSKRNRDRAKNKFTITFNNDSNS